MAALSAALAPVLDWLVRTTVSVSVLIVLIFLARWALGRRLSPRWRYGLWLLVLARLMLPVGPTSRWSVLNLLPAGPGEARLVRSHATPSQRPSVPPPTALPAEPPAAPPRPAQRPDRRVSPPAKRPADPVARPDLQPTPPKADARPEAERTGRRGAPIETDPPSPAPSAADAAAQTPTAPAGLAGLLTAVWAVVAAAALLRLAATSARSARKLRRDSAPADERTRDALKACKAEMGLRTAVQVWTSPVITTPALTGLFRPRILLPAGLDGHLSRAQLRHVLLHELAHWRRRDILVGLVAGVLGAVHWFNPLVWLALRRMRLDRELACDQTVLARVGADGGRSYGQTMIKLLEGLARPALSAGSIGIVEGNRHMRHRIEMIARSKPVRRTGSILAGALALTLAGVCLTDAAANVEPRTDATPTGRDLPREGAARPTGAGRPEPSTPRSASPAAAAAKPTAAKEPDAVTAIRLKRLRAEAENTIPIRLAELELQKARVELERLTRAFRSGASPASKVEQAKLSVVQAQLGVEHARFEQRQAQLRYAEARELVRQGKPLAPLIGPIGTDPAAPSKARLDELEAKTKVESAALRVRSAELELQKRRVKLDRLEKLAKRNAVALAEVEQAKLDVQLAEQGVAQARLEFSLAKLRLAEVVKAAKAKPVPVAWYRFDGNAEDVGRKRLHGTVRGGKYVPGPEGTPKTALLLDGKEEYVTVRDDPALSGMAQLTVTCRFKADYWPDWAKDNGGAALVSKFNNGDGATSTDSYAITLTTVKQGRRITVSLLSGGNSASLSGFPAQKIPNFDPHAWHEVALTYDGEKARLCLDQVELASVAFGGKINRTRGVPLTIGHMYGRSVHNLYFRGRIDDVRIYDTAIAAAPAAKPKPAPPDPAPDELRDGPVLKLRELPKMAAGHHCAGVAAFGGKLYVWSGYSNEDPRTVKTEVYDPKTGKWRLLAPLPKALSGFACFVLREKLYTVGGEGARSGGFSRDVYRYDPQTDRWDRRKPFPTAIWDAVGAVASGTAYLIGGRHGYGATQAHVFAYDPDRDTWQRKADMPTSVMQGGGTGLGRKIYVFGGVHRKRESHSQILKEVQIYDVDTDKWTVRSVPWAMHLVKAVTVGPRICVFASRLYETPRKSVPCEWVFQYAPATDKWRRFGYRPPEGFQNANPVAVIGTKAYLTDAFTQGRQFPRIAYELDLGAASGGTVKAKAADKPFVFYDNFNDGDYAGWQVARPYPGRPEHTLLPAVAKSPQGYCIRGVGRGYSGPPGEAAYLVRPVALKNVGELIVEMRARSGRSWPSHATIALFRGKDYYDFYDHGENRWAHFRSSIDGRDKVYESGTDNDWHDFKWTRDAEGWWSFFIDGKPAKTKFVQDNRLTSFDKVALAVVRDQSEIEWIRVTAKPARR